LRALRVLKRPSLFVSERGAPFTVVGLAKLIERAGVAAKIGFKVHMRTAKTILRAVVASALRSPAGANKHGVCGTPTLPPCWTGRGYSRSLLGRAALARKKVVNLSHRVQA
jgi:hypothetical protein